MKSSVDTAPRLCSFLSPTACQSVVVVPPIDHRLTFTTVLLNDIPTTFPPANIGRLAVDLTSNRLLAAGATPRYIAATATIDRDTPVDVINSVAQAMQGEAVQAEMEWTVVQSQVLPGGPTTGISLTAFGVGQMPPDFNDTNSMLICPDDVVILTGPVGGLGAALAAHAAGIPGPSTPQSATLIDPIHALLRAVPAPRAIIFPEHGLRSALATVAPIPIDLTTIPVDPEISRICHTLHLDPLDLPTASAMLIIVSPADAPAALSALRRTPLSAQSIPLIPLPSPTY